MFQSVIIPIFNGNEWIDQCFKSIIKQTALTKFPIEISVFNDGSLDNTGNTLNKWKEKINSINNLSIIIENGSHSKGGIYRWLSCTIQTVTFHL